ncbi:hypothetical protein D3C81_818080 [compost metagenome]
MQVVHDRQRAARNHARALVPPVQAQRRRAQAQEQQHQPLHIGTRQVLGIAEQQEGRQHHQQGPQIEVAKAGVVRQVTGVARDQVAVQHLAGGIGEVGQLQQQEADEELAADAVEADHRGTGYRHQRSQQCPWVETPVHGVFDQRHVQRREDGEQQHLWHREYAEAQVQADVGDAVLQGTDQQHRAHEARFDLAPAGQRQEYQAGQ